MREHDEDWERDLGYLCPVREHDEDGEGGAPARGATRGPLHPVREYDEGVVTGARCRMRRARDAPGRADEARTTERGAKLGRAVRDVQRAKLR